jgi:hypothetical protein
MSSPINNLPSIKEEDGIKTFRPKVRCSNCNQFTISTKLLDLLEQGKTTAICAECLNEQFKLSQETKVKKLRSYKVAPLPSIEKKEK